ncbi:DUF551 domain-containing protein [Salmonella enterica]|nr:DUF551 domain-containing protein [Salmonella enterica]EDI6982445.1 hypothetical protein [Salmonella enterica]EJI9989803.1 DUF551 domain-containing protein [Salmonella enterica]EJJ0005181.1 DUF551 domain-containing protein [Salmonella enterica]EJJ0226609.1 DUF551 domain-containing protein [Salmonella enterica]
MSTITNNKLPDERVSNATLIRLIQWADQHNSHYVAAALCELQERRKADSAEPAPIVPETLPCSVELKPSLIIGKGCKTETLLTALKRRADYYAELEALTPEQRAEHDAGIAEFIESFGNSGQLNSPVISDGWISCSERMPEDEQEVIVQNKFGYRYVSYFYEHSGLFFNMPGGNQMNCIEHILVTHWMPLPEPPQQEVK